MKSTEHTVWEKHENVVAGSGNIKIVEGGGTKTRRRLAPRNNLFFFFNLRILMANPVILLQTFDLLVIGE